MRLLLLSLLLVAGCTATAQRRPTARELGELQDSVWRRLDILLTTDRGFAACTPERETFDGSANAARASIRPYTPVTASAKTFTWKIRAATTCSPPILR